MMNFNDLTFQPSLCAFQTQLNQSMANDAISLTQDTTGNQYLDLETPGRYRPMLNTSQEYCLKSYPSEKSEVFPNCEKNFMEQSSQKTPMICLTEFSTHASDPNQLPFKQDFPRKRFRTTFSPSQLKRLEGEFRCNMYVVGLKRLRLAQELKLEERHVKIWFQNRRMKFKRDQKLNKRNEVAFQNLCFY